MVVLGPKDVKHATTEDEVVFAPGALGQRSSDAGRARTRAARKGFAAAALVHAHLDSRLSDFVDAVSRGDVVTMRTQADNAFKVLDDLSSLEAPEPLKDVAAGYVDGANSLKDALNSYIQLYTEIDGATASEPFDWSTYDSRLQAIQDAYNAGIDKLKAADEAAAGKD